MTKLRLQSFGVSLDGFGAGPSQDLEHPLGVGGESLFGWFFGTECFHAMTGKPGGATGTDNDIAEAGFLNLGAWIIGRNMFGPVRGPWPDQRWRGWWGEDPPFHVPVFVLSHHARAPLAMLGGTTFHFVTGGPDQALALAQAAAGDKDVRLGGGVATVRRFLQAGLIDHLHLAYAPVMLGAGEKLLDGIDLIQLGYRVVRHVFSGDTMHVWLEKPSR